MNRVNILLTTLSLTALLVTIERFSPTTQILLQPNNFLRFHEVFQMSVIILIGVIISFFIFKEASGDFELLKDRWGTFYGVLFIVGTYFYATGNGLHEVASHLFNTFCDTKVVANGFCGAAFFNDYYFGNIVYFLGFLLSNLAIILLEIRKRPETQNRYNTIVTLANSALFTLTMIAYAAFDRASVGFWFLVASLVIVLPFLFKFRSKVVAYPFTLYCVFAYPVAAVVSLVIRFLI